MTKSNLKITLSNHLRRGHHTCSDKDMLKESTLSVIESVSDTVDSMSKFDKEKAAEKVKSILQIAPHPEENGEGFLPSSFSRWVMVGNETDYHPHDYEKYTGEKKVLVLCTEQKYLQCSNGNKFSTGNNPVGTYINSCW